MESIFVDFMTENNPHPLHNLMQHNAEYWVMNDGNLWHLKFITKLDITSPFMKLGPYFNLQSGGIHIDIAALQKAKAQIELHPFNEDDAAMYPAEVIQSSHITIETLLAMCSEVEQAQNAKIQAEDCPSVMLFLKTHIYNDSISIVVHTDALFKGLPHPQSAETPVMAHANIGHKSSQSLLCL
ncbi:hypothetical protein EDC04DRAFT_2907407 [Pisolithus marmoratus]|nr:hypothetical protein EDC04DRAFT_2907407 [Pisolithus marmoratus]